MFEHGRIFGWTPQEWSDLFRALAPAVASAIAAYHAYRAKHFAQANTRIVSEVAKKAGVDVAQAIKKPCALETNNKE